VERFELTPEQERAVQTGDGHALVLAGPGTGKTAVIAARFAALVAAGAAPEAILTLTFSRRAAAELRERLHGLAPGTGAEVRTFHGFAARLLEAGGPRFRSRRLLDAFAQGLVFETACAGLEPRAYATAVWRSRRLRDEAGAFVRALERASGAARARLAAQATPRIGDLLALERRLAGLRARLSASDLDDLIARAVAALNDSASPQSGWLAGRYAHLLVDEFQDVDSTQLELVAALLRGGASLFAVGDPAQAIYRFRGAAHGVFAAARERFGATVYSLSESRRCPQAVCELAAATPLIGATPLRSARGDCGSVGVERARTLLDEASLVAARVEEALERGVAPRRIGVLLRAWRPLSPALAAEFRARSIAFTAPARDALLADPYVETVRSALELLRAPGELERWRHLLSTHALGFDAIAVRFAVPALPGGGFAPALAAYEAAALADGPVGFAQLARALLAARALWQDGDLGRAARAFVRELGLFARILASEPDAVAARAAVARVGGFIDTLAGAQRTLLRLGAEASPAALVELLDEHLESFAQESAPDPHAPGVRLLTVHGAKGLEFDVTIVADAVDGRFPQEARPSALFDEDELALLAAAGLDGAFMGGERQRVEEASLWYVAVTRARGDLLITYASEDMDGAPLRPSRFIPPRYALGAAAPTYRRTLERLESFALRGGDEALRGALAGSARATRWPVLADYLRRGAAAFAPLERTPLRSERPVAAGAVGDWLACPRRYYYRQLIRLKSEPSTSAELGTLLHRVLERFHGRERDFTRVAAGDAERWALALRALLEEEFGARRFDTPGEAQAVRAFLERALESYANVLFEDARATPFRVEANERAVEFALGAGHVRGRIDRVDRLDDGTRILRDYKSGRQHKEFLKGLVKMQDELEAGAASFAGRAADFNPQLALYRAALDGVVRFDYLYFKGQDDDRDRVICDRTRVAACEPGLRMLLDDVREHLVDALVTGASRTLPTSVQEAACRYCAFVRVCPGFGEVNA
jgi:DNA helicase-2/ATP-dependent DNA helicase PcrA